MATLSISRIEAGLLAVFLQAPWLLQPWIGHAADRRRMTGALAAAPAVTAVAICLLGIAPRFGLPLVRFLPGRVPGGMR